MRQQIKAKSSWESAKVAINNATNILLIAHIHPDADAIGSILSLGAALEKNGKSIVMAVDGGTPDELSFLANASQINSSLSDDLTLDLIIALDSDDLCVLGECGAKAFEWQLPKLIIDHHSFNEFYGTIHLVESGYVSTTEIIVDLLIYLGWDIPTISADALLLGILSDTQIFRVGPVKAQTFNIVQQLITDGANYNELVEKVITKYETGYLKLLGEALSRAVLENHVYWTWVTQKDFDSHGLKQVNRFFAVDDLISDKNAYIAATFQLVQVGKVRVSMRSIAGFNVGKVADKLGGGGHIRAAGCIVLTDNLEDAINLIIPLLKEEAKNSFLK